MRRRFLNRQSIASLSAGENDSSSEFHSEKRGTRSSANHRREGETVPVPSQQVLVRSRASMDATSYFGEAPCAGPSGSRISHNAQEDDNDDEEEEGDDDDDDDEDDAPNKKIRYSKQNRQEDNRKMPRRRKWTTTTTRFMVYLSTPWLARLPC
ncbi:hypothetical protein FIBSPDRAFT_1055164 [Athelia psychrophila]|uniref:Uncharacterized protein n=1 Tax=Athelia psychrophila TaxID=1759441 RepID=A0A167U678_9AGAM|nr:hypothetical protein FIBSPDRAFT_1055164 [Fibularhizoctonia sp. CBS 109695]